MCAVWQHFIINVSPSERKLIQLIRSDKGVWKIYQNIFLSHSYMKDKPEMFSLSPTYERFTRTFFCRTHRYMINLAPLASKSLLKENEQKCWMKLVVRRVVCHGCTCWMVNCSPRSYCTAPSCCDTQSGDTLMLHWLMWENQKMHFAVDMLLSLNIYFIFQVWLLQHGTPCVCGPVHPNRNSTVDTQCVWPWRAPSLTQTWY